MNDPGPELLYLLGALRDGSVYNDKAARNYVIVYYQKSYRWLEEVLKPMITKIFCKTPIIDEYKPGHYRLRIYSKRVYHLIKDHYEFPNDHRGQEFWRVPHRLRGLKPKALIPFIQGFFDAEGDIRVNKRSPYLGFSQKNQDVLLFIKGNLRRLGIDTGEIHLIDSRSRVYRFVIASKLGILRYIGLVGSSHPEKVTKLRGLGHILGQQT
ncbi:hypothetical protein HRbin02_00117 [Candidatus Calditenuaceae archaeon HR02]|nr:hypothetical protein HRbin02_00117 [Candidatus Calditenuaceae archaeon HR02]